MWNYQGAFVSWWLIVDYLIAASERFEIWSNHHRKFSSKISELRMMVVVSIHIIHIIMPTTSSCLCEPHIRVVLFVYHHVPHPHECCHKFRVKSQWRAIPDIAGHISHYKLVILLVTTWFHAIYPLVISHVLWKSPGFIGDQWCYHWTKWATFPQKSVQLRDNILLVISGRPTILVGVITQLLEVTIVIPNFPNCTLKQCGYVDIILGYHRGIFHGNIPILCSQSYIPMI